MKTRVTLLNMKTLGASGSWASVATTLRGRDRRAFSRMPKQLAHRFESHLTELQALVRIYCILECAVVKCDQHEAHAQWHSKSRAPVRVWLARRLAKRKMERISAFSILPPRISYSVNT